MKYFSARRKPKTGFTLVELLIVATVIGILSGVILTVINQNSIRSRSRDRQRQTDISKISTALELYFTDNRRYPISSSWIDTVPAGNALDAGLTSYYPDLPKDPLYVNTVSSPCNLDGSGDGVTDYRYNYITSTSGGVYILTAVMEDKDSDTDHRCVDLSNWSTLGGCVAGTSTNPASGYDYCYGTQNPF